MKLKLLMTLLNFYCLYFRAESSVSQISRIRIEGFCSFTNNLFSNVSFLGNVIQGVQCQ